MWRDGFIGQFKANLIVAFAGATMGKSVGAELQRKFRLALGNDRSSHGSAEQVGMFVNGPRAQGRPNIVANKFFTQILDVRGGCSGRKSFFAGSFKVLLLTHVANHGDHFATVIFTQPGDDDGGIQSPGIRQNNFFWFLNSLLHSIFSPRWSAKLYVYSACKMAFCTYMRFSDCCSTTE